MLGIIKKVKSYKAKNKRPLKMYNVRYTEADGSEYTERMDSIALSNLVTNACGYITILSVEAL